MKHSYHRGMIAGLFALGLAGCSSMGDQLPLTYPENSALGSNSESGNWPITDPNTGVQNTGVSNIGSTGSGTSGSSPEGR